MSSKKKIDENAVLTELSESRFFQPRESDDAEKMPQQSHENETVDNIVDQSTDESVIRSPRRLVDEQANRQTDTPAKQQTGQLFDHSAILGRPKSFYITKKQDKDLDILVQKLSQKLEGKISHKVDRSAVVRLILESNSITNDQTVDLLARRLVDKLVNQLVD
jgi:hypothetical protein